VSARHLALLSAIVLGAAVVVVIVVATPWHLLPTPPGGRTPADPAVAFTPAQIARAQSFAAALRPASLASLVLGLLVSVVFGLTRAGAVTATVLARPLGGGWAWRALLGTIALVVLGRLVTLPLAAYAEVVRHRYGLSTRGWPLWARDVAVSTAISAGLTVLALLAVVALARRAPRTWWAWAAVAAAALVLTLAGPTAYAVETATTPHTGSIPSAGPATTSGFGGGPGGGSGAASQIVSWVESTFTATTVGNVTVYDLTQPASGAGSSATAPTT
jgi:hypothetical protein